jgi:Na+/melibiose symporter-like transporter
MAQMEVGARLLIARLAVIAGFGAAFAFVLIALLPGGADQVVVLLAVLCVITAVSALTYMIRTHRRVRQDRTSRPEDANHG